MLKLAPEMLKWPWSKVAFVVAMTLLAKGLITFDQAMALVLLASFADSKDSKRFRSK